MTEDQIKHLVDRFLCWKLPKDFAPDCGISFDRKYQDDHSPTGTNVFDATQTTAMVKHMVEGMSADKIRSAAKAVCDHWAEFGPEAGFDETMESLYRALAVTDEKV